MDSTDRTVRDGLPRGSWKRCSAEFVSTCALDQLPCSDLRISSSLLLHRFCSARAYWNVFGADLKNEPHGMHWGPTPEGAPNGLYEQGQRWDEAASRLASSLHQRCSRWLIFGEGATQLTAQLASHSPTLRCGPLAKTLTELACEPYT